MARNLNPSDERVLDQASPTRISNIFAGLGVNVAAQKWLDPSNSYISDCVKQIEADLRPGATGINASHLAEYIAASVPLHCSDGWTFLARALDCYTNGSPHQAAHFAYYAELRAAMAILGSRGIGTFNMQHFIVDRNGACVKVPQGIGTHQFAWLALNHWSNALSSGNALLELFVISSLTIKDWFQYRPGSPVAASQAAVWLREWGLDLSVLGEDHLIRNSGSYRPNDLSPLATDARSCSQFLRDLWSLFEPSATRFEVLDRQLLITLVQKTFQRTGKKVSPKSSSYRNYVSAILSGLGMSDAERNRFKALFMSPRPSSEVLVKAGALGTPNEANAHERVIARAALLLRVASGFTAQLIDSAPFTIADLTFWTSPLAERRAFWEPGQPLGDLGDLWLDVSNAVDAERDWIAIQAPGSLPMIRWRSMREDPIRRLTEFDRVGLWGLQR